MADTTIKPTVMPSALVWDIKEYLVANFTGNTGVYRRRLNMLDSSNSYTIRAARWTPGKGPAYQTGSSEPAVDRFEFELTYLVKMTGDEEEMNLQVEEQTLEIRRMINADPAFRALIMANTYNSGFSMTRPQRMQVDSQDYEESTLSGITVGVSMTKFFIEMETL